MESDNLQLSIEKKFTIKTKTMEEKLEFSRKLSETTITEDYKDLIIKILHDQARYSFKIESNESVLLV